MSSRALIALVVLGMITLGCHKRGVTGNGSAAPSANPQNQAQAENKSENWQKTVDKVIREMQDEELAFRDRLEGLAEGNVSADDLRDLKAQIQKLDARIAAVQKTFSKETIADFVGDDSANRILSESKLALESLSEYRSSLLAVQAAIDEIIVAQESEQAKLRNPSPTANASTPIVQEWEGGRITGIVRDAVKGTPISNAEVGFRRSQERNYFHRSKTDRNGSYQSPPLRPGRYDVDVINRGYVTSQRQSVDVARGQRAQENVALTPPVGEGEFRIVTSWTGPKADAVSDVDSYLAIPGVASPLSYQTKVQRYHGTDLDRDDTDWIGPETVTIREMARGTYRFYVNNFNLRSNRTALGNSNIRVQVYRKDRLLREYTVPQGDGITYEVFELTGGELRDVERFNNSLPVF